jgi:CrcB protein
MSQPRLRHPDGRRRRCARPRRRRGGPAGASRPVAVGDLHGQRRRCTAAGMAHHAPDRDGGAHALLPTPAGHRFLRRADDVLDLPGGDHCAGQGRLRGAGRRLRRGEPSPPGCSSRSRPPSWHGGGGTDDRCARVVGVAVLGAPGAWGRFWIGGLITARRPSAFPYGTFAVNLTGGFLLGLLSGPAVTGDTRLVLGTALLGGYTTFSILDLRGAAPRRGRRVDRHVGLSAQPSTP